MAYIRLMQNATQTETELLSLVADLESRLNRDAFRLTGLAAASQEVIRRRITKAKTALAAIQIDEERSHWLDEVNS